MPPKRKQNGMSKEDYWAIVDMISGFKMVKSAPAWEGHRIYFSTDDEADGSDFDGSRKKQKIEKTAKVVDVEQEEQPPSLNQWVMSPLTYRKPMNIQRWCVFHDRPSYLSEYFLLAGPEAEGTISLEERLPWWRSRQYGFVVSRINS